MRTIKAIQTRYKNCLFRSRVEARWAVFFDCAREPWEYEKEGFDLGDGELYLPDFWLPQLQLWVEIKGKATGDEIGLVQRFSESINQAACLVEGTPGDEQIQFFAWDAAHSGTGGVFYEENARWCWCDRGLTLQVNDGRREIFDGSWNSLPWFDGTACNREPLARPYQVARSARFEHGESPRV